MGTGINHRKSLYANYMPEDMLCVLQAGLLFSLIAIFKTSQVGSKDLFFCRSSGSRKCKEFCLLKEYDP